MPIRLEGRTAARDLTGQKFGYLVALYPTDEKSRRGVIWAVKCECGRELRKPATELVRPTKARKFPKSCGCYSRTHRSARFGGIGDLSKTKWLIIQSHAKRKNLEFSISLEYAWNLFLGQGKRCALSGVPIQISTDLRAGFNTASLDRIDSSKGYAVGNVQWVHVLINDMKSNFPEQEFIDWCCRVADHKASLRFLKAGNS